jgi:hypothetical protein
VPEGSWARASSAPNHPNGMLFLEHVWAERAARVPLIRCPPPPPQRRAYRSRRTSFVSAGTYAGDGDGGEVVGWGGAGLRRCLAVCREVGKVVVERKWLL